MDDSSKRLLKTSKEEPEVELRVTLPPYKSWYSEYDQIYFHLAQAPRLSTALTETYGEIAVQSKRRLSKVLAETTD